MKQALIGAAALAVLLTAQGLAPACAPPAGTDHAGAPERAGAAVTGDRAEDPGAVPRDC